MGNFTVSIPEDLLSRAKVVAAMTNTSVNATVRALLEQHVQMLEKPLSGNYELLFKYSLGQLSEDSLIRDLHLESHEELRILVLQAGLPLPRLSLDEQKEMQDRFSKILDESKDSR